MTADGKGGMTPLEDRRFEAGAWPIEFDVPNGEADTWFHYLSAECEKRGWNCGTIQQVGAKENSGSTTVSTPIGSQLTIVWERKRGRTLKLKARPEGEFQLDEAHDLFAKTTEWNRAGDSQEFYLRGQLAYNGFAWRGELWLDDKLRLGPPSVQDESVLLSARIIMVDAIVRGIDLMNAGSHFQVLLRELSVLLSVVLKKEVSVPRSDRLWVWKASSDGKLESCDIRNAGYVEQETRSGMPKKGEARTIPTKPTKRPDFSFRGVMLGEDSELRVPADITGLWKSFVGLSFDQRRRFLQAGSMWQLACSLRGDQETARFVFAVSACEVLKPSEPQYRDHNVYHVVEALLGKASADLLKEEWFRPQDVRNAYLHSGEFKGSEFAPWTFGPSFRDPSFDEARRAMAVITPAAIVEWLRRGGQFTMVPLLRRVSLRRRLKEKAIPLIPFAVVLGVILGYVFGKL